MKMMRILAAMLIAAMLMGTCALADVKATGDVNLRTGPGLAYDVITSVKKGKTLDYLRQTSIDDRGIAWYLVDYKGRACWISSVYSEVFGESVADPDMPEETMDNENDLIELSEFYRQDIQLVVEMLGLKLYSAAVEENEIDLYSNEEETLFIGGKDTVTRIECVAEGYSLYGATVGMSENRVPYTMISDDICYLESEYQINMHVFGHYGSEEEGSTLLRTYDSKICVIKDAMKVQGFVWYSYVMPE